MEGDKSWHGWVGPKGSFEGESRRLGLSCLAPWHSWMNLNRVRCSIRIARTRG